MNLITVDVGARALRRVSGVRAAVVTLAAVVILGLVGCSAPQSTATDAEGATGRLAVVATISAYGDIATQIGGDLVRVTSIITNPTQDPHSFQASAQVQLSISRANVVIENGGGYDDFVGTLLAAANNDSAQVINVTDVSGRETAPATGQFNEHFWYDFATVRSLASVIATTFGKKDPGNAATYLANAAVFAAKLDPLQASESSIRAKFAGTGVAITEPVSLYLLEACGLVNSTPAKFSQAIEEGTDVPPLVFQKTLALITERKIALLAYNSQTSSPETEQLLAAAATAGVAVVRVTESMPRGSNYLAWMTANLAAVQAALEK